MFRSDRLIQLMESRGISQSELARRVKVSPTTIWKLTSEPAQGSKHLHKIARELNTTAAYLMGETDDPDSSEPADFFSSDERSWIEALRNLTDKDRAAVLQITKSLGQGGEGKPTFHSPKAGYKAI